MPPPPPHASRWLSELDVLALTLWHEARSEGEQGMLAVGCVIRNRMLWGRWGDTMREVCLAPKQFSCWRRAGGVENHLALCKNADLIRDGHRPTEMMPAYKIAIRLEGVQPDITKGSDHYYAPSAMKPPGRKPAWAVNQMPVIAIGRHVFYRLNEDPLT